LTGSLAFIARIAFDEKQAALYFYCDPSSATPPINLSRSNKACAFSHFKSIVPFVPIISVHSRLRCPEFLLNLLEPFQLEVSGWEVGTPTPMVAGLTPSMFTSHS